MYIVGLVAAPAGVPPLVGLRVLVVDDDRVALTILCSLLRTAGAEVDGAANGREALARLGQRGADLLLCDVYMPGMDGFELIRSVRQLAPLGAAALPAVAITAHPSFENRRDAQRAGFQELVGKPIEASELVALILKLCRPAGA